MWSGTPLGWPAPLPDSPLTPSRPPVLCQLPQSPRDPHPTQPALLGAWPMWPLTSPFCTVPPASQACRLLWDSSKGSRARGGRDEQDGTSRPSNPVQTTLTICSARLGPHGALGQKQPAPGWPRAGLRGLPSQEAWLAFPPQLPALAGL